MSPTLLELFDARREQAPHRWACAGAGGRLTYAELDAAVQAETGRLALAGVAAGDPVGVPARPAAEMVVAVLAVWRLGAVAVWGAPQLLSWTGGTVPAGAAFVDRTPSSSGVVVGHQALAGQVSWALRRWSVTPEDRVLCTSTVPAELCFDAFLALAGGACVVWAPPLADVAETARVERATIVAPPAGVTVPTTGPVRLVLHRHGSAGAGAGAGAGADLAEWSLYGLAEAGVVLAARRLDGPSRDGAVIGRPVDGVRLAVLDEYGSPVPPGVSGELFAGGSCVPLAVDGDAPTNAGHLLPDPFGSPGSRMLGVVARARWLADGTLQVLDAPAPSPTPATAVPAKDDRPLTPGELVVAEAWSALIGVRPSRAGDDFYALGGYSLLVPALAGRLQSAVGADVPLAALFRASTLSEQAALLDPGAQPSPDPAPTGEAELVAGATLDPAIVVHTRAPVPARPPRRILLTGATGFLGSFLLAELLRTWPDSTVICLVRATDRDQAWRRLHEAAGHYRQWTDAHRHRVTVVVGDLARPRLGLSQEEFDALAGSLDLVLHNGARINLVEPFQQLYGPNVAGTQEILRLAAPRAVPVHFVSSTAVLAGSGTAPPLRGETDRLDAAQVGPYGYVRSKWAAEELVRAAAGRGLPVTVYRPGRISGDTVNGICGRDDAFWTVLRGSMEAGAVPDGPGWQTATADLVPVDYVARAIIYLCAHHNAEGRTYHLVNPVPTRLSSVLDRARAAGVELQDVSPQQWALRLAATARRDGTHSAALPAATLVGDTPDQERILPARRYDATGARAALAGSGIDCPVVGPELLDRYLQLLLPAGAQPAGSPA